MNGKLWYSLFFIKVLLVMVSLAVLLPAPSAQAAENGLGVYPLGYNSSMAGFMPPPGFYLRNDFYAYQGTSPQIPLAKRIEADIRGRYLIDLINFTYVSPNKIFGANYGLAVIWGAVANTFIKGKAEFANIISKSREGDRTSVSDLTVTPIILGWHKNNLHIMAYGNIYVPVGDYNSDRVLNTGLNRWAVEPMVAVTWLNPKIGTELSMAMGYTINLRNYATKYLTGQELHIEWFAGQHFTKWFAVGLAGFFYQQVTGDSGPGARLGAFQGQALAIGPCLTFNGMIGKRPIGLSLRYYDELSTTNRLNGQSFFATLTFGLTKMSQ
ncbi:MAG: transporter [Desulfobaccales bacterium]